MAECATCGAGFPALTGRARYCSGACRTAAWRARHGFTSVHVDAATAALLRSHVSSRA